MRLGTYSTFDAPTKNEDKAFAWLKEQFAVIGGRVFKVMNPHDFGPYPSYEVDYPEDIKDFDCYEFEDWDDDSELGKMCAKKDDWHTKANAIEDEYSAKFLQD